MIAAGYDALAGALVILLGCGIGVLGSTVNPFATGIASGFADVSTQRRPRRLRLVILVVGLAIGIWFVLRYAERVRRDPVQVARLRHEGRRTRQFFARRPTPSPATSCSPARTRSCSGCSGWRSW